MAGTAGMVPLEIVTYVFTLIVPAFITKESHKAGDMVKVVLVVPAVLNNVVLAVVASAVFTGSTLSNDWEGSDKYNCLTAVVELIVTICVAVFGPLQPAALAVIVVLPF